MTEKRKDEESVAEREYKQRIREKLHNITPELILVNVEHLKKLQEAYEAGLRDRMYSLSVSDTQGMREVHAVLKGSRSFVAWIEAQKHKVEG